MVGAPVRAASRYEGARAITAENIQVEADDLEQAARDFALIRPRLFGIAYRMLSSVAEAEDIVQEAWIRWQATDRSTILTPLAFLTTITTRLAINVAQSARSRRETYIGPWLPEPVDTSDDPTLGAERNSAVELAVLMLLERLTPKERAAYVLREAFDYPHARIADTLQITEAGARQLVTRARKHILDSRREQVSTAEHRRLLGAFLAAAQRGELSALEGVLAQDVISYSDGGGIAPLAARIPVAGRARVAQFVAAFSSHFWVGTRLIPVEANGQPAVLIVRGDTPLAMLAISTSAEGIDQIMWLMNPEKLENISAAL
jgi:RNA polymerase sigma-70 factor (ECF subfamily)